jgi:hypothetical protein
MNLKKQIAVMVLALTATTSAVWSQDGQALQSPTAHTLQGTWRVTRTSVDCITGQDILSFPAIMTFNQGGTYTGYGVPPGGDPGQGPNTVVGSASQAVIITRLELCFTAIPRKAILTAEVKLPKRYSSPPPTASLVLARSRSSTLMGI